MRTIDLCTKLFLHDAEILWFKFDQNFLHDKSDKKWMELLTGTVPLNKLLLAGNVPVNKLLLARLFWSISSYWPVPLKSISFQKIPHPLKVLLSADAKVLKFCLLGNQFPVIAPL